ncbi:MAG: enoyl-CoA hydratase/isomerase family protein [Clostridia bacterium]|nr:enoyl-CoA hydratase/isomerase family protein [Clostridia bacterium]
MNGVTLEKKENYAILTVDIPETRNALSVPIVKYMDQLVDEVIADARMHCLVITGGGPKSFIAGADIRQLVKMTPEDSRYSIEVGHKLFSKLETMDIPVVAAINGYCLGGGLEIAMSCDIRICSANAKFGLPEINIGMIPGWGGTLRLARLIGESRAKNMLLRGKMITAQEALSYGLIAEVYESVEEMRGKAEELARELAAKAPITIKMDKRLFYDAAGKQPTDIAQRDANTLGFLFTTHDAIEGLTAFLEKRAPVYENR